MRSARRKRQQNRTLLAHLAVIVVVALIVPAGVNFLLGNLQLLLQAGERAAMLAVAVNMPDAGFDLLQERFRDELYSPEAEDAEHGVSELPTWPAPRQEMPQFDEAPSEAQEPQAESPGSPAVTPPKIPEDYQAELVSENFSGKYSAANYIRHGAAYIRNETRLSDEEVAEILETPMAIVFEDSDQPQVLIVHTHATESFERYDTDVYDTRNTWRSTDNNSNMVAVGAAFAEVLEQNGIAVVHDITQHDYPSYNGSYERSARTVQSWLDEYPTIKVVLDLHRDAMERDNQVIVKPVAEVEGARAAQIMIIAACDDEDTIGVPQWRQNLRFAALFADYMEGAYPELTRPVYLCYRKYNMDLSTGALLLEFGSNANTLDEAVYAATLAAQALADLMYDNMA